MTTRALTAGTTKTPRRSGAWVILAALFLAGCAPSPSKADTSSLTQPPADLSFTGSGQQTTEVFELAAGDYLVTWSAHASDGHGCPYSITLEPVGHDEFPDVGAFDIAPEAEVRNGSTSTRLDGGRYAFDIGGLCEWTLSISPR